MRRSSPAWNAPPPQRKPARRRLETPPAAGEEVQASVGVVRLAGYLTVPEQAAGIVVFAHGSGSSRHSPRNRLPELFRGFLRAGPPGPGAIPGLLLTAGLGGSSPAASAVHLVAADPQPSAGRLSCAPAIPGRYLPLRVTGLRLGNTQLAIDIQADGWDLTGLDGTHTELIREPRNRNVGTPI